MPKAAKRTPRDRPETPPPHHLPSLPAERDPLAGLENHPLFCMASPKAVGAEAGEGDAAQAHWHALRLAYAQLRRAEAEIDELRRQLETTEAAKRQLLRQLEATESELAAWKARAQGAGGAGKAEASPAGPGDGASWQRWEALFTGELPSSKMTLNDIPVELKAFLTATKAALQAEVGAAVTERDQVICSLAAYRLITEAFGSDPPVWRQLMPKDRSRFAVRYFGYILDRLANLLAGYSKLY